MKPNRPTRPLQLERRTLRQLAATDLTSVAAGIATGCDTKWVCPTVPFC